MSIKSVSLYKDLSSLWRIHRRQPRRGCRGRIPTNILVGGDTKGNAPTNILGGLYRPVASLLEWKWRRLSVVRGADYMLSEKSQWTQNDTMFVDLDWPLNASSPLSASAELLVLTAVRSKKNELTVYTRTFQDRHSLLFLDGKIGLPTPSRQ